MSDAGRDPAVFQQAAARLRAAAAAAEQTVRELEDELTRMHVGRIEAEVPVPGTDLVLGYARCDGRYRIVVRRDTTDPKRGRRTVAFVGALPAEQLAAAARLPALLALMADRAAAAAAKAEATVAAVAAVRALLGRPG